jgi:hypothetical protein
MTAMLPTTRVAPIPHKGKVSELEKVAAPVY